MRKFKQLIIDEKTSWKIWNSEELYDYIYLEENGDVYGVGVNGTIEELKAWTGSFIEICLKEKHTIFEIEGDFNNGYIYDIMEIVQ